MSEEIKAKTVEDENPSTVEKETKALKKIGANIGEESITKVDLRQPKEKEAPAKEVSENNKEAPKENESKNKETKEEEISEEPIIEEVKEDVKEDIKEDVKEEKLVEKDSNENIKTEKSVKEEPVKQEEPELNIPEGISELVNFINETGGSMEDFIRLNKDYNNLEDDSVLKEYYNQTKSHLNSEEISFLMKDNFSYDNEIDDPTEIKRKQLAYKEELAKAKNHLEGQKEKYYKEVKTTGNLSKEQQKAVDFFNRYNTEQQEIAHQQEKATNQFTLKTNEVFNQEFKGFDFNIDDKKYRYKLKDVDKTKNTQMDIMNVVGSYLDKNNTLKDGYGYHKALFAAKNADSIANHFYQLGKTEAIKEISSESKNINMDPRQTSTGVVESGGIKVRAISGDDSSKLRIKLKK